MAEKKVKEVSEKTTTAKAAGGASGKKIMATEWTYDVLRRPIISEKTAKCAESNAIAFEIDARATKKDVAKAFIAIYNVAPRSVNILNVKGKTKGGRFKGSNGSQKTVKKAYVTLSKEDKVDVMGAKA